MNAATRKMDENIDCFMNMVPVGVAIILFLVALYFNILTTCVLMGISHIITTADTVFIVLIALFLLLYIFRRRKA